MTSKHQKHEMRESAYKEYEEHVKECDKKHPANKNVKGVSLWTIHSAPKHHKHKK